MRYTAIYIAFIFLGYNCRLQKEVTTTKSTKEMAVDNVEKKITIDTNCILDYQYTEIKYYQCYKKLLLDFSYDLIDKKYYRNYGLEHLLDVTVKFTQIDSLKYLKADEYLYQFYKSRFDYLKNPNYKHLSPMQISNFYIKNTLKEWATKNSFTICVLYMGKNRHDSMGHGDCTNVGVKFFDQIVAPKIKTIYGQDLNDYLGKHLDYDNEKNYEDCFDSFYNTLYPLIKKAWEEGKIELHAPDFK